VVELSLLTRDGQHGELPSAFCTNELSPLLRGGRLLAVSKINSNPSYPR